jgi:HNH endonuclease
MANRYSPRIPPLDRLLDRCEWQGDCLVWTGKSVGSNARYGVFNDQGRQVYVHRWVYEHTVGPIPEGHEIDHVAARGCVSKLCVNPVHLEPVTHGENRRRARLTVCRAGKHDLSDPANQRFDRDGNRRGCAICHREAALARYHRGKD